MKLWSNGSVPRSAGGFNPERRLLAAVLQRAITDFLSGEGELHASAKEWMYGEDDPNEAFGFSYICEALDFHREELRKAVMGPGVFQDPSRSSLFERSWSMGKPLRSCVETTMDFFG